MSLKKKIARSVALPLIVNTGLEKRWLKSSKQNILNLMYHGVVKKDSNFFSPRHMLDTQFEKHMKYLAKNFDVISTEEAFEHCRNGTSPKRKSVTVTFDDGYKNNLDTALPIIEKYGIKTTFFISGVCAENNPNSLLWADLVQFINHFTPGNRIEIGDQCFVNFVEVQTSKNLYQFIKSLSKDERDNVLNELRSKYDVDNQLVKLDKEIWELMNQEDLRKLSASPLVTIGSHGYLHYNLANIDLQDAVDDMLKSKQILEKTIGKEIKSIAYPDGNYDENVKQKAEEMGYTEQFAVTYRSLEDKADKRILDRHGLSSTTTFESNMFFLAKAFKSKGFN